MAKIKQQHADLHLSTAQTRAGKINPNWNQASLKASHFVTFAVKIRPVTIPDRIFPQAWHTQGFALGCIWEFCLLPKDTSIRTAGVVG